MPALIKHPRYGNNPCIPVCIFCHDDKDEVLLLGAKYPGKAPTRAILDTEPCEACREFMEEGILGVFVFEETWSDPKRPPTTGKFIAFTDDQVRDLVPEPALSLVLEARHFFIRPSRHHLFLTDTSTLDKPILWLPE